MADTEFMEVSYTMSTQIGVSCCGLADTQNLISSYSRSPMSRLYDPTFRLCLSVEFEVRVFLDADDVV